MKDSIINLLKVLLILAVVILVSAISIVLIPTITILVFAIKCAIYIYNEIKSDIMLSKAQKKAIKDNKQKEQQDADYANKLVEGIQKNEQPGMEPIYSDEYIPIPKDNIIITSTVIDDILFTNNTLEEKIEKTTDKKELERLKRELTINSFKLQDAMIEEIDLLKGQSTKYIADNKEQIQQEIPKKSKSRKRSIKR